MAGEVCHIRHGQTGKERKCKLDRKGQDNTRQEKTISVSIEKDRIRNIRQGISY